MKKMKVRELKQNLSGALRSVREKGEPIEVSSHGVRIVPLDETDVLGPSQRSWAEAERELFRELRKREPADVKKAGAGAIDELLRERRRR